LELLKAADINTRVWAADALGYIHADPKVLVPVLIKRLMILTLASERTRHLYLAFMAKKPNGGSYNFHITQ